MKKPCSILAALALIVSLSVPAASALEVEDAKQLLSQYYYRGISQEVLELDSLDEILAALGDPYTVYFSQEEYEAFLTSVNGETLVGIGVSIQNEVTEHGLLILSILPNSPAEEAGLEQGDFIVSIDGITVSETEQISALSGPEGTPVELTVRSGKTGEVRALTLERREVRVPTVTSSLVDGAAVLSCSSFGDSTSQTIAQALTQYADLDRPFILDLRLNPGGVTEDAARSASYFIGSGTMAYFQDSQGKYTRILAGSDSSDLTDQPLIILTDGNSASASELFSSAIRDYGAGIALGSRTYGKGVAQIILDQENNPTLFDGDAFKITTYRFYSPSGSTNDTIGVLPTLLLSQTSTPTAALLLTAPKPARAEGYLKLELAGQTFYLDLAQATEADNQAAFTELLEALPPSAKLYKGSGTQIWTEIAPAQLAQAEKLPFTSRGFSDTQHSPYAREIDTLAAYQLLGGYEDGTFRPETPVTRGEFCAMVTGALDLPSRLSSQYSDVPQGAWYASAISTMTQFGFFSGNGNGTFRPEDTISYEEMTTVLACVAAWCNMTGYELSHTPLTMEQWLEYQDYSDWAQCAARDLDQLGVQLENAAPGDCVTREKAAGMLCRMMEAVGLIWD